MKFGRRRNIVVAILLIAGLLLTSGKVYTDYAIRQGEAAYPPIGKFVTVEGVALHYLERGEGQPIILIHGSDGVLQDFILAGLMDRLAAEYRVIAFDRPGHGYSGRVAGEPLTVEQNARLIHGALEALGVESPIVAGHSYGGAVALQYAVDYPADVAGVVLLAAGTYSGGPDLAFTYHLPDIPVLGPLFMNTLFVPLGRMLVPVLNRHVFYPEPVPDEFFDLVKKLWVRPSQYIAYTDEWKAHHASMTALAPRYGEIDVPVAIVAGEVDRLTPMEKHALPVHAAIAGSTLLVLENTGHEVHYQHPEVVVDVFRQIAERVWSGR